MTRNRFFTQVLVTIVALAMAVPVFALDLPRGARLTVHDERGSLIGRGHVEGNEVELDIQRGSAGFATLSVELPGGELVEYEVLFAEDGGLLVIDGNDVIALSEFVRDTGREYDFDYDDDFRPADDGRDDDWDDDDQEDDDWDDDDRDDDDRDDDDRDDDDRDDDDRDDDDRDDDDGDDDDDDDDDDDNDDDDDDRDDD